jgi:hypothetical protein
MSNDRGLGVPVEVQKQAIFETPDLATVLQVPKAVE